MPDSFEDVFAKEIGSTSVLDDNGYIVSEDYNNELRGRQRIKIFDKMRLGDSTIKGLLQAIKLPIKSANWRVEPASEDDRDKEIAAEVERQIFETMNRSWKQMLHEILLYLEYGSMPFEMVFDVEDSKVVLKKLAPRFPESIMRWKMSNDEPGVVQITDNGTFDIPMEKMVVFVNEMEGDNWEGISLLRPAYRSWYMKDKIMLIDAMAHERQGLGVPKATISNGTSEGEKDALEAILKNLKANEKGYILAPEGANIEFMDMKANGTKNGKEMIKYHDHQMLISSLTQFLQLGSNGSGSYALSKDQSELFILSLESVASYVAETFNKFVVTKIVDFNYDTDVYPELTYDNIGNVNVEDYALALQRVAQAQALDVDDATRRHVRDILNIPLADGRMPDKSDVSDIVRPLESAIETHRGNDSAQQAISQARDLISEVEEWSLSSDEIPEGDMRDQLAAFVTRKNEVLRLFDAIKKETPPQLEQEPEQEPQEQEMDASQQRGAIQRLIQNVRNFMGNRDGS